ncbi:hypothetical protein CAG60_15190 [Vibrio sp. V33_P6A3T137]|uniref:hypothetical protein n=1 Tax=Vibrio sp. V33_P6A3T137 TaxID=1938685 RepID=UPI00137330C0|nr:hypothetical protein [Vibrio sp. V33_P6A3T137]NAW80195.1 hypothetical protein [Vibrio sp. V33_P6A3T137]
MTTLKHKRGSTAHLLSILLDIATNTTQLAGLLRQAKSGLGGYQREAYHTIFTKNHQFSHK